MMETQQLSFGELITEQQLARHVLDEAEAALFVCDKRQRIFRANLAAQKLCNCDPAGMELSAILPLDWLCQDEQGRSYRSHFSIAPALEGETLRGTCILDRPDQDPVYLFANTAPYRGPQDEIICCILTLTDITTYEREQQQIRIHSLVAQTLAEAGDLTQAAPRILELMGEGLSWDYGGIWLLDQEGRSLNCLATWHANGRGERMAAKSPEFQFAAGVGLPGRIFKRGQPEWIQDIQADPDFLRARYASADGLQTAMIFPIASGNRVVGVLEAMSRRAIRPDPRLRSVVELISSQLGLFLERQHTLRDLARLAALVNFSEDAIYAVDQDGVVTHWNPASERLFGYLASEIVGQSNAILFPPDLLNEYLFLSDQVRRGGSIEHFDTVRLAKDGQRLNVSVTISPIRDADGEIMGASVIARDIALRKQVEQELGRQAALLDLAPNPILVRDLDDHIVYWNRGAERLYGWTADEALGHVSHSLLETRFPTSLYDQHALLRSQGQWEGELVHRTRAGDEVTVLSRQVIQRDLDGRPLAILESNTDITERKQAEEKIRFQASLLDAVDQAVVATDLQGRILYWSRSAEKLYGWSASDALGQNVADVLQPGAYEESARQMDRLRAGESWSGELQVTRRDGDSLTVFATTSPVFDEQQRLVALISISADITARKRMEAMLARREREFATLVENSPDIIYRLDRDLRIVFINSAVQRISGFPPERFLGKLIAETAMPPNVRHEYERLCYEAWATGEERSLEFSARDIEYRARIVPERGPDGTVESLLGVSQDITTSKRAEQARQRAMNILNGVVNGTTDAVYVKAADGTYLLTNEAGAVRLGHKIDEVIGRRDPELVPPDLARTLREQDKLVMERGEPVTLEIPFHLWPEPRIYETVKAPYRDTDGRIIGVVGVARDVTAQRRASEAARFLAEASHLLSTSLDYETTLARVAQLAVPRIADWCAVDMLGPNNSIQRLALAHSDPAKVEIGYELSRRWPPNFNSPRGLGAVLRTGQPELMSDIPDELLISSVRDPEQLRLLREVGLKSYIVVPLNARGRILGALTFATAESGRRLGPDDLNFAELLAQRAALAIDNARLYREIQQFNAELEQRVRERAEDLVAAYDRLQAEVTERTRAEEFAQTLLRVSKKLNATLDLNALLDALAREAIAIAHAERGFAGLVTPQGAAIRNFIDNGELKPFEYTWTAGQGIPGWVVTHREPYLSNDVQQDPQVLRKLVCNQGLRNVLCTPVLDSQGDVIGFIEVQNKRDGSAFTDLDLDTLLALSPLASIALRNALDYKRLGEAEAELHASFAQLRALAARLQSVREEERADMARELHDELGQALTALKFDLSALTERLSTRSTTLRERARAISDQIDATIKTVRRLSTQLRPGMLDDLGLPAAIEWQAQDFQTRTGIVVQVDLPIQDLELTRAQATAIFRTFQETLTNVARHADATRVSVRLRAEHGNLVLDVQDNGRGIELREALGKGSLGLLGMRERAEQLGGTFQIQGAPGQGTHVKVTIPLAAQET